LLNRRSADMSAREFESRSHRWAVGKDRPPCQQERRRWRGGVGCKPAAFGLSRFESCLLYAGPQMRAVGNY
jgi:hypothetical protein